MSIREIRRLDDGFTLVELLVATTMALIVFAATLSALNVFSDSSHALTSQNDSQNGARLAVDHIASQLRNITSSPAVPSLVERATSDDLVFQTMSVDSGVSASERVRYCLGSPNGDTGTRTLFMQQQTNPTGGLPWLEGEGECPDTSDGKSASVLIGNVTNGNRAVFTYDDDAGTALSPASLDDGASDDIKSIGIDLFVNSTPSDSHSEYELRSSALLRNADGQPHAAFTWSQDWSGTVVLDGGASYSATGEPLTYLWSCETSENARVKCTSSGSTFAWTPSTGTGTYTVTLQVTDQAGLQSEPVTNTVTVR